MRMKKSLLCKKVGGGGGGGRGGWPPGSPLPWPMKKYNETKQCNILVLDLIYHK